MFVGHYGPAVWDAHRTNGVKLWHGFLAVQAMDLVFCVLALFGLEGGQLPEATHPLAFNIPYSHSLLGALIISVCVALIYLLVRPTAGRKGAVIMGGLAFSHWPLDWLVHRPDLPLIPHGDTLLGLGLWNYAWPTYALEVALLAGMMMWWMRVTIGPKWTIFAVAALVLILSGLQFIVITAPTLMVQDGTFDLASLGNPVATAIAGLIVFIVTILAVALIERRRVPLSNPRI